MTIVVAVRIRLGIEVYNQPGKCPAYGKDSDALGDHCLVCGNGGERIARHNSLFAPSYQELTSGPQIF